MKICYVGRQEYSDTWLRMREFTQHRDSSTEDEVWLLEHFPVYTQGLAGKAEHILNQNSIPIIQSDRGGQITYHGPGQLVAYVLMDIGRRNIGIKSLVSMLEQVLMAVLMRYNLTAHVICGAPGVYIEGKKIGSIGLRVKNGCTYHGISLNVAMDLAPFKDINPCGFSKMEMTQISCFYPEVNIEEVSRFFIDDFLTYFAK